MAQGHSKRRRALCARCSPIRRARSRTLSLTRRRTALAEAHTLSQQQVQQTRRDDRQQRPQPTWRHPLYTTAATLGHSGRSRSLRLLHTKIFFSRRRHGPGRQVRMCPWDRRATDLGSRLSGCWP